MFLQVKILFYFLTFYFIIDFYVLVDYIYGVRQGSMVESMFFIF